MLSPSTGESSTAPDTPSFIQAWPCQGSRQCTPTTYTPYNAQGFRVPSTPWPGTSVQLSRWAAPYPPNAFLVPITLTAGMGAWPYPSVPDTGYNTMPLQALPFGNHAMPLGDHLTMTTKECMHSFRIGAASTAAALGYNVEDIKWLGRWSSSTYHRYIRTYVY